MAEPRRVKVAGDRFHPVLPAGAVYVGRQAPYLKRSPWANPYVVGKEARDHAHARELYRNRCLLDPTFLAGAEVLAGKDLACWCPLDKACHVDVLLELVAALVEPHDLDPRELA